MAKKTYKDWSKEDLISRIEKLEKRKKYGLVWDEERTKEVFELQALNSLPVLEDAPEKEIATKPEQSTHILIEGDNFHALSVLSYTHEKSVDVIYIDPPYNTGNQSWRYNNKFVELDDAFRHSKWLSWMNNRLQLARNLLKETGVLAIAIDDYELFTLGLLLNEVFGEENRIGIIVVETNPRGRTTNKYFATSHEYCLFYARDINQISIENLPLTEEQASAFKFKDEVSPYRLLPFRRSGGLSTPEERPNSFYPIYYNEKSGEISVEKFSGSVKIEPIDSQGRKRVWRFTRPDIEPSVTEAIERGDIVIKKNVSGYVVYMKDRIKTGRKPKTAWIDSKYDASTHGTILLEKILGKQKMFPYPKSIHLVRDVLNLIIRSNKNAVVLDFFAGSGTTAQAVMEINNADKGMRQCILTTNNENGICEEVCYPRVKKIIRGYTDPKGNKMKGLGGNLKYYRTAFVPAEPSDENKELLTRQSVEMLCLREGTFDFVTETDVWKLYENNEHYTAILFDQLSIPDLKEELKKLKKIVSVYVFSLEDDNFANEFADMKDKVKVCSIPEAILRVYRRIYQ